MLANFVKFQHIIFYARNSLDFKYAKLVLVINRIF